MHSLSVRKILIEGTQKTLYQNTGQDPLYLIRSSGSKHKTSVLSLIHIWCSFCWNQRRGKS